MSDYTVVPMDIEFAKEISNWKYDEQYSIYSFNGSDETIKELIDNNYHAVLLDSQELMAYYCFGSSAQIPTINKEAYRGDYLDIGLGLRPDQCGMGKGENLLRYELAFAQKNLINGFHGYRITVAEFNERAIRVYQRIGFVHNRTVEHQISGKPFLIMTCTNLANRQ